jgi:hypothetical protein
VSGERRRARSTRSEGSGRDLRAPIPHVCAFGGDRGRRPGRLRFCGRVDHGLVPAARRRVGELLAPLVVAESPEPAAALLGGRWTRPGPDDPAPVFVRPELAVEVSFLGWESGRLRHPAYSGLSPIL